MRREEFLSKHADQWRRLEHLLSLIETRRGGGGSVLALSGRQPDPAELDALYRLSCRHLALARQRQYGDDLTEELNELALRAYRCLYAGRQRLGRSVRTFLLEEIPSTIRSRWRVVALAAMTFLVPLAAMASAVLAEPWLARTMLSSGEIRLYEMMYDPASPHFGRERASDGDLLMFGYYIANNVGIAFKAFAWGLAGGIGSLFVLVFNGLSLGAVMGHLGGIGYGRTFFPFVAGHSGFELTALVLSGAAGLELGWAVLAPGRLTRTESLRRAGRQGLCLMTAASVLLVFAAFVEAYWSSKTFGSAAVKYAAGAGSWALLLVWILRAPRRGP